jgi:hypothetical protein
MDKGDLFPPFCRCYNHSLHCEESENQAQQDISVLFLLGVFFFHFSLVLLQDLINNCWRRWIFWDSVSQLENCRFTLLHALKLLLEQVVDLAISKFQFVFVFFQVEREEGGVNKDCN